MPESCSARIKASLCSGVLLTWDTSTTPVVPVSIMPSAVDSIPGIGIRRRKRGSELADDVAIVVGIDAAIGQDVAQNALVGVAMGIDEAGNQDSIRHVDHRG